MLRLSLIFILLLVSYGCQRTITVEGRVYLMGSAPFPAVALAAEDNRTYTLLGPIADSIRVFQNRGVRIYGKLRGKTVYTEESIEIIRYEILYLQID